MDLALAESLRASLPPLFIQPAEIQEGVTPPGEASVDEQMAAAWQDYTSYYSLDVTAAYPAVRHSYGWVESAGHRLAVQVFRTPGAQHNLLLVHGYLDHVGIYGHMIRYGLDRGFNVVAFDLPGHGLSNGPRVSIDNFSVYSQALADVVMACAELPGNWRLLAQSMGGAIVLDYLLKRGQPPFDQIVLLAPLIRPRGWWRVRTGWRVLHRFRQEVKRDFAENSHDPAFLEFLRADPLQHRSISLPWVASLRRWLQDLPSSSDIAMPVLLIQGKEDRTVDWPYNVERYRRLLPGLRVEYLQEGRHQLVNESVSIRDELTALIDDFFAPGGG
jgi:alpha-beta hydrolase superfamily lysophospholipase